MTGFLEAVSAEDYAKAAHYLDLRGIPLAARKNVGPQSARALAEVLERTVWFDIESIPDDSEGAAGPNDPAAKDLKIAEVPMPGGKQGVRLERVRDATTGARVWLFSRATVQSVDRLHDEHGLPDILQRLPAWSRWRLAAMQVWQWGGLALVALSAWFAGHLSERSALWAARRASTSRGLQWIGELAKVAKGPTRQLVALLIARFALPYLSLPVNAEGSIDRIVDLGLILAGMRAAMRVVTFAAMAVLAEGTQGDDDPARARTLATRVSAVRRIAIVLIVTVGFGLGLMQFPVARSAGWSLLGSAGIAGAILGFAAQKTVASLLAGILIALTQPLRIGDTVIVENEWGTVEEIGLTHVVVRIWDLRRLVVPVTYFLDQPFQNWTKTSAELLGTVMVHADFQIDVEAARAELDRVLQGEPLWNGKTKNLVVHELTDRAVVLRVTVSADDANKLWDLRCLVREKMLGFLQAEPSRLPRWRMDQPVEGR